MVGAVGLTLKRPVSAPNVDVFAQHNVDFQKVLVQIPGGRQHTALQSVLTPVCSSTLTLSGQGHPPGL